MRIMRKLQYLFKNLSRNTPANFSCQFLLKSSKKPNIGLVLVP